MTQYEPVLGLEIHAQLNTNTKLFCNCSTEFGHDPNANTCPVCLGMPGALPVLNEQAVKYAIQAGLALNCDIAPLSVFSRKNYFYPDLPKGYQISQFDLPICENGHLDITVNGEVKRIGITRIHMEEDAGKLVHQGADAIAGADYSLVDLNRSSMPLIEIVSEPDIRSAEEARAYMEELKLIVEYIGVCDGNLEEGSFRADANISLRPVGQEKFGTRAEVKNLNSFRSLERAVNYEIARQTEILDSGGDVIQETRNFDDASGKTTSLRSKEEAHDYRYFPEPDLKPLRVSDAEILECKDILPELPQQKRDRYHALSVADDVIEKLIGDREMNTYFETCLIQGSDAHAVNYAKWIVGDLNALLKEKDGFESAPEAASFLELMSAIESGKVSGKMAKDILGQMVNQGESFASAMDKQGGGQISDQSELQSVIDQVLAENPDVVEKIKGGKTKSADFLMGQVMKLTKGRAKPDLVRTLILQSTQG